MIKNNLRKIISMGIIAISLIALNPIGASAEWRQNSTGWWYTEGSSWVTGWKLIDGKWYYFYSDGYMAKRTTIGGYYLDGSGAWVEKTVSKERALEILLANYREFVDTPSVSNLKMVKDKNTQELYYVLGGNLRTPGTDNIKPYFMLVNVNTGEHSAYGPMGQTRYFENFVDAN